VDVSIGVVAILFTLSLGAAYILFKILQSSASINKKEYQMGGAIAGFAIIFTMLDVAYERISKSAADATKQQLSTCQATLGNDEAEVSVSGTVVPAIPDAEVVYATKAISLGDDGVFHFSARKKDLKSSDPPAIYVTTEQNHVHLQLDPDEDLSNLKIPAPKEGH